MKKALITGGAGGLGLATAKYLVENGWIVYAADYNKDALEKINEKTLLLFRLIFRVKKALKKPLKK